MESDADDKGLSAEERMEQRRKISYPTILMFEKWIEETYAKVLPKSRLGEALAYAYSLLPRLSRYVNDGRINIDNNLIENAIRPLALGDGGCPQQAALLAARRQGPRRTPAKNLGKGKPNHSQVVQTRSD